jgi:glycosyltransferase involved in cell wall biosynthesis
VSTLRTAAVCSNRLGPGGARLVLVHDQAADLGGHERAVQALLDHYPAATALAPHFVPTNRPQGHDAPWDGRGRVIGRGGRRRGFLAPIYARRVASAGVLNADVVLSITQGGWSLAARVAPAAVHLCYSGGLPPHLYGHSRLYLNDEPWGMRPVLAVALPGLRAYDRKLMRRPRRVITNSKFSARELQRVHGRAADVVYPPVRTDFFTPRATQRRVFLVVARLVTFKRVDLVIEAFRGLDAELVVAGGGPMLPELRRTAPRNVRFLGPCDDETLLGLYRSSRALICPSLETFGIAMAEAQATGTPVIALKAGGALEVVTDRRTGILLDRPEPRAIAEAVRAVDVSPLDPRACRDSAERFTQARFTSSMERIIDEEVGQSSTERM